MAILFGNGFRFFYFFIFYRDERNFCPDDVLITSDPKPNAAGMIEKDCAPGQSQALALSIQNMNANYTLVFERHLFLWDTGVFKLRKKDNKEVRQRLHLPPGNNPFITCQSSYME